MAHAHGKRKKDVHVKGYAGEKAGHVSCMGKGKEMACCCGSKKVMQLAFSLCGAAGETEACRGRQQGELCMRQHASGHVKCGLLCSLEEKSQFSKLVLKAGLFGSNYMACHWAWIIGPQTGLDLGLGKTKTGLGFRLKNRIGLGPNETIKNK